MFLFDNIVKNEVTFTELIRNLCGFTIFRREITEWILASCEDIDDELLGKFSFDFDHITTQVTADADSSGETSGRPDIILDNGAIRIVLELKVDPSCALTTNQPVGYLDELDSRVGYEYRALAFMVPRGYQHVKTIHDRETKWRTSHGKSRLPGTIPVLYWQDFTQRLRSRGVDEVSILLKQYIELTEDWFPDTTVAVADADATVLGNRDFGAALQAAYQLVDDVRECLKSDARVVVSPRRAHEYDYSVTFRNAETGESAGYFGLGFYDFETGRPFLVGVPTDRDAELQKHQKLAETLSASESYAEREMTYYPLSPKAFDTDSHVAAVLEILSAGTGIDFRDGAIPQRETDASAGTRSRWLYEEHGSSRFGATFNSMVTAIENVSTALKVRYGAQITRANDFNEYSMYASMAAGDFVFGLFYHDWKDDGVALWVGTGVGLSAKLSTDKRLKGGVPEGDYFYRAVDLSAASAETDLVEHIIAIARDLLDLKSTSQ
jgi:hypothetical protein